MGVMGSGKSAVGRALADRLKWPFQEGDDFHSAQNVEKMHAGAPLDDQDRAPWLDAVAGWIASKADRHEPGVISCSALRRAYRDRLRRAVSYRLPFVLLNPRKAILRERLAKRTGHFATASLLDSQLETLEIPDANECTLTIDNEGAIDASCAAIIAWLQTRVEGH
jgi:gluconokinase